MDPEAFLDLANQVIKLKMFPYFDIAHSLLCALAVREDLGVGECSFILVLYCYRTRNLLPLFCRLKKAIQSLMLVLNKDQDPGLFIDFHRLPGTRL